MAAGAVNHSQALAALFARHLDHAPESAALRQALGTIQALDERAVVSSAQDTLRGGVAWAALRWGVRDGVSERHRRRGLGGAARSCVGLFVCWDGRDRGLHP